MSSAAAGSSISKVANSIILRSTSHPDYFFFRDWQFYATLPLFDLCPRACTKTWWPSASKKPVKKTWITKKTLLCFAPDLIEHIVYFKALISHYYIKNSSCSRAQLCHYNTKIQEFCLSLSNSHAKQKSSGLNFMS